MQIWAESGKSALPICNYSQILYQFLTFTQNLKRSPKILHLCRSSHHKIRLSYCREKAFAATLCPIAEYAVNPFPASAGSKGITH